jgi:hypothetical protein
MGIASLTLAMTGVVFFSSCGNETTTGEDYGDLMQSPSGLVLTESEHQYGWGKSDCTSCHNLNNIHLNQDANGLDDSGLNYMPDVRSIVSNGGISSCITCHLANGVQ